MSAQRYTVDRVVRVYDNREGSHFYVGPDADGLDMVEVRDVDAGNHIDARLCLGSPEHAVLVAKAILELYGPKDDVA